MENFGIADALGVLTGGITVFVIYLMVSVFGKKIKELDSDIDDHEKKIIATDDASDEADQKAAQAEEEANDHYTNDSDSDVVDRAWDAFGSKPPGTGTKPGPSSGTPSDRDD
jgi:hypothetical protein